MPPSGMSPPITPVVTPKFLPGNRGVDHKVVGAGRNWASAAPGFQCDPTRPAFGRKKEYKEKKEEQKGDTEGCGEDEE